MTELPIIREEIEPPPLMGELDAKLADKGLTPASRHGKDGEYSMWWEKPRLNATAPLGWTHVAMAVVVGLFFLLLVHGWPI